MFDSDRSNFIRFLKEFPDQIDASSRLAARTQIQSAVKNVQHIVFAGMGGSAISGDLLSAFLSDQLTVPVSTVRGYELPGFVNQDTLFIAISYSGNTEETLTVTQMAARKGAQIIGLSSGGSLKEFCDRQKSTHLKLPEGYPPRQALGFLFFSLLFLLEKLELVSVARADIDETRKILLKLRSSLSPESSYGNNLANHIAQNVYNNIPVIYTASPLFHPVVVRWRNQFNENSKAMAFSNVFPELNHNEIMGWEGPYEVNRHFRVIILRDIKEPERNVHRVKITKKILKDHKILVSEVFALGASRMARLFSQIYIGDWASYYLAMIYDKDPITIDSIDLLKKKLSEI